MAGGDFDVEESFLPSREDCATIYRLFLSGLKEKRFISENELDKIFSTYVPQNLRPNTVKFKLILEIFNELKLIKLEYLDIVSVTDADRWSLRAQLFVISKGEADKIDLESSKILQSLRNQIRQ